MTSEVLILNKRAIVIGADSAVTTSGGDHPRYSKSANKIFELSNVGSVAAAIYGNAAVDNMPWELAIKLFRNKLGNATFPTLGEFASALFQYLQGNVKLFPIDARNQWVEQQFDRAIKIVLQDAAFYAPGIFEAATTIEQRKVLWDQAVVKFEEALADVAAPLTRVGLNAVLADLEPWRQRAETQIAEVAEFAGINAAQLAEVGHRLRYRFPSLLLDSTGIVIAGYGEDEIFPSYEQYEVFGHIGDELFFTQTGRYAITHNGSAMIQPLAQTSMIDMFSEGFGKSLEKIIGEQGQAALAKVFAELAENKIDVPPELVQSISTACHENFMGNWKLENWKKNFHPLLAVLQSLSVQEMAHLAESLLNLESLKERVTSPSESVGGPIDVAAITKGEGLVWVKRKHYFDADMNPRYQSRLERSMT